MYSKIHFNLVEYPVFYEKNLCPLLINWFWEKTYLDKEK